MRTVLAVALAGLVLASIGVPATHDQVKLSAADGDQGDHVGSDVDMDNGTILVGASAHEQDNTATASVGAAYVFVPGDAGGWTQQARLLPSNDAGTWFGGAVALDGDTAVGGGKFHEGPGGAPGGAAYVFERSGTTWTQVAYLQGGDTQSADQFGEAVDVDDGTVVVGAPQRDRSQSVLDIGAAYVFTGVAGDWAQQAKLEASDAEEDDQFGWSVAVLGDTVFVGAPGEDGDRSERADLGAVYVFQRSGDTWTETDKLQASDPDDVRWFGSALDVEADRLLVGAMEWYGDHGYGADVGAGYVFVRSDGEWTEQAQLFGEDANPGDEVGESVALDGERALLGARRRNEGGQQRGAVYAFMRGGGSWPQLQKITAAGPADDGDWFGDGVGLDGATAAVGAPTADDPDGTDSGVVYVQTVHEPPTDEEDTGGDGAGDDGIGHELVAVLELEGDAVTPGDPTTITLGEEFTLDATGSSTDQGEINGYILHLDDDGFVDKSGSQPTFTHTYTQEGTFTVRLRVMDTHNHVAWHNRTVEVVRSTGQTGGGGPQGDGGPSTPGPGAVAALAALAGAAWVLRRRERR